MILGLPGETKEDMLSTIRYLNAQPVWGIKLQLLHVLRGTDLADLYQKGAISVLDEETYLDILTACLEALRPQITVHRVTGDGPKNLLIAPAFSRNKRQVLNHLQQKLRQEDTWQGRNYHDTGTYDSL